MARVKTDDKWGYIDKFGKEVAPCKYEYADVFSEDLAAVKYNGKWYYVEKGIKKTATKLVKYNSKYYLINIYF